jgi:(p)ppGpp synthase/HD superfamily hydrolase
MLPISKRFREAVDFTLDLHADHSRKTEGVPYIAHLFSVAALAMEHGADEDVAIAALLHDAVEDRGGRPTLERIRERFGERVARVVEGCTDSDAVDPARKAPWRQRKQRYLEHLREADEAARLVSACDKLHNARCILADLLEQGQQVFLRFNRDEATLERKREAVLWYYRALAAELGRGGVGSGSRRVAGELGRVLAEIERLAGEAAGRA